MEGFHFLPAEINQFRIPVFTIPDTETDTETDKNGLHRIGWRFSYWTEPDINRDSDWVLYPYFSVSVSVSVIVSIHTPLVYLH